MASQCSDCGSTEVERDEQQGQVVCTGCGRVLQDYILLAQQQFQETSSGGVTAVGQHVGEGGPRGRGYSRESRAVTLDKGKKRIERLAAQLGLRPNLIAEAFNYFRQAVTRHMTQGRNSEHFAAACLYLACRLTANSEQGVMLLDFSDLLQTDVYTLGRVYLQLCSALHVTIPLLDPCLYIQRFAHGLQFGDKTRKVEDTAMRLVQRMKKDWMHWGRRPTGLCGAALLVAARIYDFSRTIQDIVKVVRIGEGTIKKRLMEFEKTDSSKLTIEEFDTKGIDLEQEMDPPCYTEGLRKAKLAQLEEQGVLPCLTEELQKLRDEIEQACVEAGAMKGRRYKKMKSDDDDSSSVCSTAPSLSDLDEELAQYADILKDEELLGLPIDGCDAELDAELTDDQTKLELCAKDAVLTDEILMPPPGDLDNFSLRPTAASLGLKDAINKCMSEADDPGGGGGGDMNGGELDLTDIDDDEIDKLILNEEEVKIKTAMWMRQNAEFLKEMKEKEEKKAKEREQQPELKKQRRGHKRKPKVEAKSAGEAFEKMLHEKKLSKKINYDVLKGLNPSAFKTDAVTEESVAKTSSAVDDSQPSEKKLRVEEVDNSQEPAAEKNTELLVEDEEEDEDYNEEVTYGEVVEDYYSYHDEEYNVDAYEDY